MKNEILMWLGQYRDSLPIDAVKRLQDIAEQERFKKPTDEELVSLAILLNHQDGRVNMQELTNSVAMCMMVIDRLHEHGNIYTKSTYEKEAEN